MYESHKQTPVSSSRFARRVVRHAAVALGLVLVSLAMGMTGYLCFEPTLKPVDAFLNAAMLLGGMGPVDPPRTTPGKVFAGCYALYAGLVFIVTAALVFTPVLHRLLHRFHWDTEKG